MRTIEEVVDILTSDLSDAKWKNISLEYVPYGKLLSEILEIHKAEQRPKGEWIQTKDDCDGVNFYDFSFECSKCGKEQSFKSNYCPNCGAEMSGGEKMVDLIEILKKGFCGEMSEAECANVFSCKECEIQYEERLKEKVQMWLSSFDTSSATKCFEAVNLLKQRLEGEDEYNSRN